MAAAAARSVLVLTVKANVDLWAGEVAGDDTVDEALPCRTGNALLSHSFGDDAGVRDKDDVADPGRESNPEGSRVTAKTAASECRLRPALATTSSNALCALVDKEIIL